MGCKALEYQDYVNIACDFDRWALLVACRALFDRMQSSSDGIFGFWKPRPRQYCTRLWQAGSFGRMQGSVDGMQGSFGGM